VLQLLNIHNPDVDEAAYLRVIERKTAVLFSAATRLGALLAGASAAQEEGLAQFGLKLGFAFQIADDVLNVVGDQKKLGKRTGSDAGRGKSTYPALLGLQKAQAFAHNELRAALAALKPLGPKGEPLAALARFVIERDR